MSLRCTSTSHLNWRHRRLHSPPPWAIGRSRIPTVPNNRCLNFEHFAHAWPQTTVHCPVNCRPPFQPPVPSPEPPNSLHHGGHTGASPSRKLKCRLGRDARISRSPTGKHVMALVSNRQAGLKSYTAHHGFSLALEPFNLARFSPWLGMLTIGKQQWPGTHHTKQLPTPFPS